MCLIKIYRSIILTLLLAWSPYIMLAQTAFEGQVLDKTTEAPIPFATVTMAKARTATRTTDQGYFNLNVASGAATDTLIFTSVGYLTYKMAATAYIKNMKVRLTANTTDLKQVSVSHTRKTKTLDAFGRKDVYPDEFVRWDDPLAHIYSKDSPFLRMTMFAKLFEVPEAGAAITNVQMGRSIDRKQWFYTEPDRTAAFRLKVLSVDGESGGPGDVIFSRDVSLKDTDRVVNINFKPGEVVIPATKCFVAIEWIRNAFNEVLDDRAELIILEGKLNQNLMAGYYRTLYQPLVVGYTKRKKDPITPSWMKIGNVWQPFQHPDYEVALSVTFNY